VIGDPPFWFQKSKYCCSSNCCKHFSAIQQMGRYWLCSHETEPKLTVASNKAQLCADRTLANMYFICTYFLGCYVSPCSVLHYYPVPDTSGDAWGDGVLFSIDLFVCLFVSLLTILRENGWTYLHEIFTEGVEWPWDDLIQFWVNLEKPHDAAMHNTGMGFVVLQHHSLFFLLSTNCFCLWWNWCCSVGICL